MSNGVSLVGRPFLFAALRYCAKKRRSQYISAPTQPYDDATLWTTRVMPPPQQTVNTVSSGREPHSNVRFNIPRTTEEYTESAQVPKKRKLDEQHPSPGSSLPSSSPCGVQPRAPLLDTPSAFERSSTPSFTEALNIPQNCGGGSDLLNPTTDADDEDDYDPTYRLPSLSPLSFEELSLPEAPIPLDTEPVKVDESILDENWVSTVDSLKDPQFVKSAALLALEEKAAKATEELAAVEARCKYLSAAVKYRKGLEYDAYLRQASMPNTTTLL